MKVILKLDLEHEDEDVLIDLMIDSMTENDEDSPEILEDELSGMEDFGLICGS